MFKNRLVGCYCDYDFVQFIEVVCMDVAGITLKVKRVKLYVVAQFVLDIADRGWMVL